MADVEALGGGTAELPARPLTTDSPAPGLPAAPAPASPAPPRPADDKVMTLVDHLAELRHRLVVSVLAILVGSAVGFYLAPRVVTLLVQPIPGGKVVFTELGGAFFLQLKIALVLGFALALPVVLYQLWAFVSPGLTPRDRRLARPWLPLAMVFFLLGIGVAYLVLPFAVNFLLSFALPELPPLITAENYFGFVTTLFIAFGVVMEFPIALVLLSKMGILSLERLRRSRRYAFLAMIIFAVVATPGGDPVSPLIMSGVMYLLYELTIALLARSARPAPATDA